MDAGCARCGIDHRRGSPECPGSRVGATIAGKYRLDRLLGAGGMGAVYEATHEKLGTKVALKMLHPRFSENADVVARFYDEARQAAALAHPGIVEVRDFGQDADGSPYIEMELLVGRSVADLARAGAVPIPTAVDVVVQALGALGTAHAAGLVHRDLKPDNLFLVDDAGRPRVKIVDFGIAKVADAVRQTGLTRTGEMVGTVLYASPEQLLDASSVDLRSDIYSMGATLFELVTGRTPVQTDSAFEAVARITKGDIARRARPIRPDTPAWLDDVLARALAQEPADRFASADEMATALREAKAPSKRGPLLVALAAVAVLGIGGVVVAFSSGAPDPAPIAPISTAFAPVVAALQATAAPISSVPGLIPAPGPALLPMAETAAPLGSPATAAVRAEERRVRTARPDRAPLPMPTSIAPARPEGHVRIVMGFMTSGPGEAADLGRVFRTIMPRAKSCYEDRLASNPELQLEMRVGFSISELGTTGDVEVTPSGVQQSPAVQSCVQGAVSRLRFASPGGRVRVQTALAFSPAR